MVVEVVKVAAVEEASAAVVVGGMAADMEVVATVEEEVTTITAATLEEHGKVYFPRFSMLSIPDPMRNATRLRN